MSSTGIISNIITAPITSHHENRRQTDAGIRSFSGLHEGIRQVFGTISNVHPEKPAIKAYDDDGSYIADHKWIPLNHSTQEIAERFGTVRIGMRVLVSYKGPDGAGANATIIGTEGERNLNNPLIPNEVAQGWFRTFSPGL